MALKDFTNGEVLTADDVDIYLVNTIAAIKSATESVTSSTTLQNDDELVLALAANSTYEIRSLLKIDGSTAGDIKVGFTGPSGSTPLLFLDGLGIGATDGSGRVQFVIDSFASNGSFGTTGVGDTRGLMVHGLVVIGSTAGNLQLQWAQGTSSAFATRVFANSFMWARRIS